jgi:uncharacterized alpha-E superfamily protein
MHEFIDRFQRSVNSVGDAIFETFFALRSVPTQSQWQSQ